MRFDFQPILYNTKIFKTNKQRKIFLLASCSAIGFFIITSSLINSIWNNKISSTNILPKEIAIMSPSEVEPDVAVDTDNQNTLIEQSRQEWQSITVQAGDTLSSILRDLKLSALQAKDITTFINNNHKDVAKHIKGGQEMKVLLDHNNQLSALRIIIAKNKTICLDQIGPRNYKIYQEEKPIIKRLKFTQNKIASSFFAAAQAAGLNDALIMQMADIFDCDIDFVMDVRPNDKFRILYEENFVDNQYIGTGNILVAEIINQHRTYQAIRFTDNQGRSGYYSPDGYSLHKTFLRSPVKFSRISSRFSSGRHHPILHRMRAHKGVDYVAPAGTPIKAAADGRIISLGRKGGYGNAIELQHGSKYSTLYAHLSGFAPKLAKNSQVKQGQVIGFVGRTGLASGDHLHYEFRVDGIHRDPLTVQFPKALPLSNHHKVKFLSHAQQMLSLLNDHDSTLFAKN